MLHELVLGQLCDRDGIALGIEPRRLVILEKIAVELIRAGTGHKRHRGTAAAAKLCRKIRGHDLEFLDRVRIWTKRRKIRASSGGFVYVDTIKCEIKGPVAEPLTLTPPPVFEPTTTPG